MTLKVISGLAEFSITAQGWSVVIIIKHTQRHLLHTDENDIFQFLNTILYKHSFPLIIPKEYLSVIALSLRVADTSDSELRPAFRLHQYIKITYSFITNPLTLPNISTLEKIPWPPHSVASLKTRFRSNESETFFFQAPPLWNTVYGIVKMSYLQTACVRATCGSPEWLIRTATQQHPVQRTAVVLVQVQLAINKHFQVHLTLQVLKMYGEVCCFLHYRKCKVYLCTSLRSLPFGAIL